MAWYRLYFHGRSGSIQGRDDFETDDDRGAMIMAELLWDACSDSCETFELWQGARRVDTSFSKLPRPSVSARTVSLNTQQSLIRHEEAIRDSRWSIARSRRLLEHMESLKKIGGGGILAGLA